MKVLRTSALRPRALAAAMMLASPVAAAAEVQGKARVVDGRTLEVAGRRFQLAGIEPPALEQVCRRADHPYACGKVARAVLWDLIGGREVACRPVAEGAPADAGAIVAICKAGEVNLGEGMVAAGWAQADRAAPEAYGTLEEEAKAARRGLWTGTLDQPEGGRAKTE